MGALNATGNIRAASGAAATPSFVFNAATTTGLYWVNPGIGLTVAGTSVGTITATGLNGMAVGATTKSTGAFTTLTANGATTLTAGTASTTTTTGTLVVTGGLGVSGTINAAAYNGTVGATTANTGAFTTLSASGLITPTSSVGIKGTVAADSAAAGSIGEYATASSTAVSLTTATATNATSVSLTAGDWDVWGTVQFIPAATTTMSALVAGVNTTTAAFGAGGTYNDIQVAFATGSAQYFPAPVVRVNVSVTTTVYLVAQMNFAVSTATCNGYIYARRRR